MYRIIKRFLFVKGIFFLLTRRRRSKMKNNKFILKNMSYQFSPELTPTPSEVNLTDEQKRQLEQLNNVLNKLQDLINHKPDKISHLINNFFRPKEKILPNGQKVSVPSQYDQLMQLLREVDPSFVPIPGWRNEKPLSSIPSSGPFPLNENQPSSTFSPSHENPKK
jgi:hypothetical protein